MSRWVRYVALGDAITDSRSDGWLGWADRLAMILDGNARLRGNPFEFSNLGTHGDRVRHVVDDQVPRAIELRADLVSILIGGSDLVVARADPDTLAAEVERGVAALRASGADVLLATCFDPRSAYFLSPVRRRAAAYNANLWSIARTHNAFTLDLWSARELESSSMWAADRIHLTAEGHRLLASKAAHCLGVPYFEVAPRR